MHIPARLNHTKYYIAAQEKNGVSDGISDWFAMNDALSCLDRYREFRPEMMKKIQGVIRVNDKGAQWVLKFASLT